LAIQVDDRADRKRVGAGGVRIDHDVHEARWHVEVWRPEWALAQIGDELFANQWIHVVGRETERLALQRRRAVAVDELHDVELVAVLPVGDLVQVVAAVLAALGAHAAWTHELDRHRVEEFFASRG
jgi:hypothetical protein